MNTSSPRSDSPLVPPSFVEAHAAGEHSDYEQVGQGKEPGLVQNPRVGGFLGTGNFEARGIIGVRQRITPTVNWKSDAG